MFLFCTKIELLGTHPEYTVPVQEMEKQQLSECLKKFYRCIRKKDGSFFKVSSIKAIRAVVKRFLKSASNSIPWPIISDTKFKEANDALDAFAKSIRCEGKVARSKCYLNDNNLVHLTQNCPSQLLRTSLFYISLYLGKRGRENRQ